MRYGFVGAGNIAAAIITGAVASGKVDAADIGVFDLNSVACATLSEKLGVISHNSAQNLIEAAEIIFVAVKPHIIPTLLPELQEFIKAKENLPTIVSVAAGVTLSELERYLGLELPVIRVMPNLNSTICAGMTAYCCNAIHGHTQAVVDFFEASGGVVNLEEKFFAIFSVLGGSTPAFTYLFIDSLAKAAHKLGMSKQQALQIAAQSVLGSAKMLQNSTEHPWALIDKVCSPGGLTIEGICALQDGAFESTVVRAMESAILKNDRLK